MSGSGGSGGGYESQTDDCASLVINTQLSSPKASVIDLIMVGEFLDVRLQMFASTEVVAVFRQEQLAGGLASPDIAKLRRCISEGTEYKAEVTAKSEGQVRVRVKASNL
ncbi:MAG: hypothetical protein ACYCXP_04155 [Leptospirillum sp.]